MRIAFIGLGNMGGPMALNLLKAGHALTVHDVRREAAAPHLERLRHRVRDPSDLLGEREVHDQNLRLALGVHSSLRSTRGSCTASRGAAARCNIQKG